jgi:hypothetical protein
LGVVRRAVEEPDAVPEGAAGRCCGAGAGGTETTFLFPHELARRQAIVAALAMPGIFRFIICSAGASSLLRFALFYSPALIGRHSTEHWLRWKRKEQIPLKALLVNAFTRLLKPKT